MRQSERAMDEFVPPKLFHVRVVRLGLVHGLIGLLTLAVGVMDVGFSSIAFDVFPLSRVAAGIWVGCMFLFTGAAGVVTSRSEVRRRATNLVFMVTSCLSLLLSIVLIALAVAEIANSEYVEGGMDREKEFLNITSCINASRSNDTVVREFRCISIVTFNQKLATAILLLIFGYFESLIAYHSVLTSLAVSKKQDEQRARQPSIAPPPVSVETYFEEQMRNERNEPIYLNDPPEDDSDITTPTPHSAEEFPDSDQFRAHLEGLEGDRT